MSRCLPCHRRRSREYYEQSAIRRSKLRSAYVQRKYGVTMEDLSRLLGRQQGKCAICRRDWRACPPQKQPRFETLFLNYLCIDHDHTNGAVRGLLCSPCNTAIGMFEENLTRFENAVAYLQRETDLRSAAPHPDN